jgi:hypothetical protein
VVWKDVNGAIIPVVRVGNESQPAFYGNLEFYDSASKAVWASPFFDQVGVQPTMTIQTAYALGGCTGTAYAFQPPGPRYSFTLSASAAGTYYVVPDNVAPQQVGLFSINNGSSCQSTALAGAWVVPVSSLTTVTIPASVPGTPPYHPEAI